MKRTIFSLLMTATMLLFLFVGLPIRAEAEEGITLRVDGSKLIATYNGSSSARLIAASYDQNGQLKAVQVKDKKPYQFSYDQKYDYRVFALDSQSSKPLCEAGTDLEMYSDRLRLPQIDKTTAAAGHAALQSYATASLLLNKLASIDNTELQAALKDDAGREVLIEQLDKAIDAYDTVMASGAVLRQTANTAAAKRETTLAGLQSQAPAVLQSSQDEQRHWAEELTENYDGITGNKKLARLGEMMGCDARRAYEQLVIAQEILKGHYYTEEADLMNNWVKGLTVVKTTCKVSLYAGSVVLTGGTVTAVEAAGFLVSGADAMVDVVDTGAVVILGDDHKITKTWESATKPVGYVSFLFSTLTGGGSNTAEQIAYLGDVYEKGKETIDGLIDFLYVNNDGTTTVESVKVLKENFIRKEKDAMDSNTTIETATDDLTKDKEPVTDESLENLLDDIESQGGSEDVKDLNDLKNDLKRDSSEENAGDDTNEGGGGSGSTQKKYMEDYNDGMFNTYYVDENGDFIGLFEGFENNDEDVLLKRAYYGEKGKIEWETYYNYDGTVDKQIAYSKGEVDGSYVTERQYYSPSDYNYNELPEGVKEQLKTVQHFMLKDVGDGELVRQNWYDEPWYSFELNGEMLSYTTGIGDRPLRNEYYTPNSKGVYSLYEVTEDQQNGTYTQYEYYKEHTENEWGNPWALDGVTYDVFGMKQYYRVYQYRNWPEDNMFSENAYLIYQEWWHPEWVGTAPIDENKHYSLYGWEVMKAEYVDGNNGNPVSVDHVWHTLYKEIVPGP